MRTLALAVLCALALAAASPVAFAQSVSPDSGARVRLRLQSDPRVVYQGFLLAPIGDSVVVRVAGEPTLRVPRSGVRQLQVGRRASRGRNTLAGIGIGVVTGAAVGALIGSADSNKDNFFGPEFAVAIGASFFGLIGGVTGGIVGYNHRGTAWHDVPLAARVGPGGVRVSLTF